MEKENEDVIDKPNKDIESEAIEKFKNIIFNNWDTIKETIQSIKKNETKEINLYENGKIEISFYFYYLNITHFFNKTISTYNIEKNSRKINFKKKEQDIQKIIFHLNEIIKYCNDLQFVHAVYDEDDKSNISVTSSNCASIFFNEKIIEIYDDEFLMIFIKIKRKFQNYIIIYQICKYLLKLIQIIIAIVIKEICYIEIFNII